MHTSPTRKLLLGVLALGGIAFGVDRLILQGDSGPAHAAADLVPSALEDKAGNPPADRPPGPKAGTLSAATDPQRVAVRLAALARPSAGTPDDDAFAPPPAWLARIAPQAPAEARVAAPSAEASPQPAPGVPEFRLTLVTRQSGVAVAAVINGTRVALGETIDGYRLVGLAASEPAGPGNRPGRPAKAVLEGPGGPIELALDPHPGQALRD